jgi:YVTN family beta-propeller protein
MAVINGTPTGKVYVTSPESDHMTIIRTDTDIVETTVPLQGKGIMVRAQLP